MSVLTACFPRAGLLHLGKGWIVRDTTTKRLSYWANGLFYPSWNRLYRHLFDSSVADCQALTPQYIKYLTFRESVKNLPNNLKRPILLFDLVSMTYKKPRRFARLSLAGNCPSFQNLLSGKEIYFVQFEFGLIFQIGWEMREIERLWTFCWEVGGGEGGGGGRRGREGEGRGGGGGGGGWNEWMREWARRLKSGSYSPAGPPGQAKKCTGEHYTCIALLGFSQKWVLG